MAMAMAMMRTPLFAPKTDGGRLFALYEINMLSLVAWILDNFVIIHFSLLGFVASYSYLLAANNVHAMNK